MKKPINGSTAHANIVTAYKVFDFDIENGKMNMPFFDIENDFHIKAELWMIDNVLMRLMDLFYGINKNHKAIVFANDFISELKNLEKQNHLLKSELETISLQLKSAPAA